MSNEELVLVDSPSPGVFVLTLNAPKVNALSTAMLSRIHYLATDLTILNARAVVITGGDRLFAAGADISEFGGPSEAKTIGAAFHAALNAVAALPCFTIAAVSGFALGGGCELAMMCDFIIAADSLPIHLAQLLNKPHFILFPNGHPRNFMTPYALEYNSHGEFSNFKLPV